MADQPALQAQRAFGCKPGWQPGDEGSIVVMTLPDHSCQSIQMSWCAAIRPSLCRTSCLRVPALHTPPARGRSPLATPSTKNQAEGRVAQAARMSTQATAAGSAGGGAGGLPDADAFPSLVSAEWLHQRLGDSSLKVLDATWYLPNAGKDAVAEHRAERIPGARFFGGWAWLP